MNELTRPRELYGQYINVYREDGKYDVFLILSEIEDPVTRDEVSQASFIVQAFFNCRTKAEIAAAENTGFSFLRDELEKTLFPWGVQILTKKWH